MAGGPCRPWRLLPSPVLSSALGSAPMQAVKPLGTRRCRRLGFEQRGPWKGLVLTSPALSPGSGNL